MRTTMRVWSLLVAAGLGACGSPDGQSGEESVGEVTQNLSGTVLFVANSTTLSAADTAVRNRLQTLGFTVQVKAAPSTVTADATGKALVVVSSTVTSGDVGSKFKSVSVPVLTWESAIYDDMALVPSGAGNLGTQATQTSVTVATPSHPMAAGLTGTQAVAANSTFSWGKPAASAVKVATLPSDATKSLIFGFESGAALSDGTAAAARRVGLFLEDNTATGLNTNGWNLFNQAVTWAVSAPATASNVRLTVNSVDDFVYVWVNGVRRKVYGIGQNAADLDVSSWFANGANTVRVQAINTGGPASYSVQLKVNGATVINETCFAEPCSALPTGSGIVLDKSFTVSTVGLARQTVNVTGLSGGKLYLDDQYTGLTVPTTLSLPQGNYTLGLGVSSAPSNGSYYERALTVAGSSVSINVSQNAPLNQPNHTKVAILPIRNAIHGPGGFDNTGVLQDWEIPYMQGQTLAARDVLLEPYSYNLTTWDVDLLPTVETTPLRRPGNSESAPDTDLFLTEAGLSHLKNSYDQIIFFYSKFKQDGSEVANTPCCFWAWGQAISFMDHMARGSWATDYPNLFLLHESLHDYESYQIGPLHKYNGIDGTHGSSAHGYLYGEDGEEDFLKYYRFFIRGQVPELKNMRSGITWPSPAPTSADLFVGVFDVMRRDVNWLAPGFAAAKSSSLAASEAPKKVGCVLPAPPLPKH